MNVALVGGFVLALSAALIAGVLWLASGGALQKKYDPYLAIMDESVSGLNKNAPVKYNGVEVGKVQSIQLDKANPERVRLVFDIERGTPIKEDTFAVLKTQGLTGIAYVELAGGKPDSPMLLATVAEPYPVIQTKPSLSARLENVLTSVLAKLDRTSSNIDAVLSDENRVAFSNSLADLAVISRTFAARKDTIDAGITSAARTLDNSARVTAQMGPVIDRIGRSADAVEKMGTETAAASHSAVKTIDAVGTDVQRLTAETLPELDRLLGELNLLSASLRRLSAQTERSPNSLVFGRSPVPDGPGESTMTKRQP